MNSPIKKFGLLGIVWLGLPLAESFTSIQPFVIDIDQLDQFKNDMAEFLNVDTLIINVTSKK